MALFWFDASPFDEIGRSAPLPKCCMKVTTGNIVFQEGASVSVVEKNYVCGHAHKNGKTTSSHVSEMQ